MAANVNNYIAAGNAAIKNSYAALAAEHQPEGEVVAEESKRTTKGRWVDKKGRSHKFSVSTHTGDEVHVSSIVKAQYPAKRVVITGQSADKKKKVAKKKVKEETTNEGLGLSMAATAGLTAVGNIAKAYGASQAAKGAIIGGALSGAGSVVGGALNYAASRNKNKKSESKKKKMKEDRAFDNVVAALRAKHGKDSVVTKDNPIKPPTDAQKKKNAAERQKRQDADNKAFAGRAKKAGYKSTQDYANVVARYGSEDNMKKGKGLGT